VPIGATVRANPRAYSKKEIHIAEPVRAFWDWNRKPRAPKGVSAEQWIPQKIFKIEQ